MVQGRGIPAEPRSFPGLRNWNWESAEARVLESEQLYREKTLDLKVSLQYSAEY